MGDYNNFNPFEANDESAKPDTNGCFPGQSRGYKSPNRPDQSWEIMQKERAAMDELAKDPKFSIKGKPGNFSSRGRRTSARPPKYVPPHTFATSRRRFLPLAPRSERVCPDWD